MLQMPSCTETGMQSSQEGAVKVQTSLVGFDVGITRQYRDTELGQVRVRQYSLNWFQLLNSVSLFLVK